MANIINKFGEMVGWNNITINLLGRDIEAITAIKYSDKTEAKNVYGAGSYPQGRSRGNYEAEAQLTLLREEVTALMSSLPMGMRLQDIAPFDIIVEYTTDKGLMMKDVIRNAQFTSNGVDVKQNDGTISIEFTLVVSHIAWHVI